MFEEIVTGNETFSIAVGELVNTGLKSKSELIRSFTSNNTRLLAVVLLNPENIVGPLHLVSAAENALNAWHGGYAVARTLDMEILRFASGQRQISSALDIIGPRDGMPSVAVVVLGIDREAVSECTAVLTSTIGPDTQTPFAPDLSRLRRIMSIFDISETELRSIANSEELTDLHQALTRCVVGRVSLVAIES